jgi:uncharacterized protein YdeI (YjbR/CyaY-like superfamily)
MKKAATPDEFYANAPQWKSELAELRKVMLTTGLDEEIKWGAPCYTLDGINVVGVADFKNHFALWFHQGGLLKDESGVLVNAQEGVTKAQRQWRMTSKADIKPVLIKSYVKEAMANAKSGKRITADRDKPVVLPDELVKALKADKAAGEAFEGMSKACRREYAEYISTAKQDETKQRRLEKILPMIRAGGGLNDRYK